MKGQQDAHDWITRSGVHGTKGSRRGTSDFATDGFDVSMETDIEQSILQLRLMLARLKDTRVAMSAVWGGDNISRCNRINILYHAAKRKKFLPRGVNTTKTAKAFREWLHCGQLIQKIEMQLSTHKGKRPEIEPNQNKV